MTGRPAKNNKQTERNRASYKKRVRDRTEEIRIRQRAIREHIQGLKISLGCKTCGYAKCARALEWHHIDDDKEHNVARMMAQGRALTSILEEIKKCVCLCSNCHREVHDGVLELNKN